MTPAQRSEIGVKYASLGWSVVLLHGIDPVTGCCECAKGATCPSPAKHPRFGGWRQKASANPHVVKALLEKHPNANVGIATGKGFGVVLDLDPRNGSDTSIAQMEADHGALPPTLTARTGGGGAHLVFSYPEGLAVGNSLPALVPYAGIDVKGDSGLVVAAPSVHASGGLYSWDTPLDTPLAPLPAWMLEGVAKDTRQGRPESVTKYGWVALLDECAEIAAAGVGDRHETILASSRKIGNLVAGAEIDRDIALHRLEEAALRQRRPLDLDDLRSTIDDGLSFGMRLVRTAPPAYASRSDALRSLAVIIDYVRGVDWSGHRGKRMYEVLMAHTRIATRAGGPSNYRASLRNVAMEMGTTNQQRVILGQEECQEEGWLSLMEEAVGTAGRVWRLRIPKEVLQRHSVGTHANPLGRDGSTLQHPLVAIGHDAFREKRHVDHLDGSVPEWFTYFIGLGKTGYRVCDALWTSDTPLTRSDLAKQLGVHRSTVGRQVPKLVKAGLAVEHEGVLTAVEPTPELMANIAAQRRTAGAALQQREGYEWTSPARRADLTPVEAAALVLPETDPQPLPPARGSEGSNIPEDEALVALSGGEGL